LRQRYLVTGLVQPIVYFENVYNLWKTLQLNVAEKDPACMLWFGLIVACLQCIQQALWWTQQVVDELSSTVTHTPSLTLGFGLRNMKDSINIPL
jgi:hypothetical protein